MSNIASDISFVDESYCEFLTEADSCKKVIEVLYSDDYGAPPRMMTITVKTEAGREVRILIPFSTSGTARVQVDGDDI